MSLNVCTDQLAMTLAAPGQLKSVSNLATDPNLSFLHEQAKTIPKNRGLAEEVFLATPDLVVTGDYSLHNTTELLTRLGFRVETFPFDQTLSSIPETIRRMGALLGQESRAEQVAADFERERRAIDASVCEPRPSILSYDQNGITAGRGTLTDSVLTAAGFRNLAADLGYQAVAPFPLEQLVVHRPDVILLSTPMTDAPSLADQIALHPALAGLKGTLAGDFVPQGTLGCAGPWVIEAMKALRALRERVAPCGDQTQ